MEYMEYEYGKIYNIPPIRPHFYGADPLLKRFWGGSKSGRGAIVGCQLHADMIHGMMVRVGRTLAVFFLFRDDCNSEYLYLMCPLAIKYDMAMGNRPDDFLLQLSSSSTIQLSMHMCKIYIYVYMHINMHIIVI